MKSCTFRLQAEDCIGFVNFVSYRSSCVVRSPSMPGLFQLDQDALRAGRMDKCHEGAMRTRAWRLVDQPHAAGFQLSQDEGDVVDTKRDVVQAGATPVDVFRNGRIPGGRLEQLQRRVACGDEMDAQALRR